MRNEWRSAEQSHVLEIVNTRLSRGRVIKRQLESAKTHCWNSTQFDSSPLLLDIGTLSSPLTSQFHTAVNKCKSSTGSCINLPSSFFPYLFFSILPQLCTSILECYSSLTPTRCPSIIHDVGKYTLLFHGLRQRLRLSAVWMPSLSSRRYWLGASENRN